MTATYGGTILTNVPNNIINLTILASTTGIQGGSSSNYAFKEAKDTIENVYFETNCLIETIPSYCFYQCKALICVDFSPCSKLTKIEKSSFFFCSSLSDVIFPNSLTTLEGYSFQHCPSLKNIIFPKSISNLPAYLFSYCDIEFLAFNEETQIKQLNTILFASSSLLKFKIPSSLVKIEGTFFGDCNIKEILIDDDNANFIVQNNVIFSKDGTILYYFLSGIEDKYTIPENITSIYQYAFYYSKLSFIIIPKNIQKIPNYCFLSSCISNFLFHSALKSIGLGAFSNNNYLESIILPDGIEEIGANSFQGCINLVNITFPNSCKVISNGLFYSCSNLQIITIPEGVETIEQDAFKYCRSLSFVYLPSTIKSINRCFSNCAADIKLFKGNVLISYIDNHTLLFIDNNSTLLQEIQQQNEYFIPSAVKKINDYGFEGNTKLNQIIFENANNIEYIGKKAFSGCANLKTINFLNNGFFGSNGLYIGNSAFSSCSSLKINLSFSQISNSYLYIDTYAFCYCDLISSLSILQDSNCSLTLEQYSFGYCNSLTSVYLSEEQNSSIILSDWTFSSSKNVLSLKIKQASYSSITIEQWMASNFISLQKLEIVQEEFSSLKIGSNSFRSCNALESITILQKDYSSIIIDRQPIESNSLKLLSFIQGKNCSIDISDFFIYPSLSNVVFHQEENSILSLSDNQFQSFSNLQNITLSNYLEEIPSRCFSSCTSLETIHIPSSCKLIESYAFYNCTNLKVINLPKSITTVGSNAFRYCNNLERCLTIENDDEEFRNKLIQQAYLPSYCICDSNADPYFPTHKTCFTPKAHNLNNINENSKICYILTFILS